MHGPACGIPWGYDPAHTDSPRPYTLEELHGRAEPPHRFAYPDGRAYLEGWALWRALRRDAVLSGAEATEKAAALLDVMGLGPRVTALLDETGCGPLLPRG